METAPFPGSRRHCAGPGPPPRPPLLRPCPPFPRSQSHPVLRREAPPRAPPLSQTSRSIHKHFPARAPSPARSRSPAPTAALRTSAPDPRRSQHSPGPPGQARGSASPALAVPQRTPPPALATLDLAPLSVRPWHPPASGLSTFSPPRRVPSDRRHRRSPSSQPPQWEIGSGPSTATSGFWSRKRKGSPPLRGGSDPAVRRVHGLGGVGPGAGVCAAGE